MFPLEKVMTTMPGMINGPHDDWEHVRAEYENLLSLAMENSGVSRDIAALLLN